jgi:hypothetical protein
LEGSGILTSVTIEIYNLAGNLVRREFFSPGGYNLDLDSYKISNYLVAGLANGVYIYRIIAKDDTEKTEIKINKLAVLK